MKKYGDINSPQDLKKLDKSELQSYANYVRDFLVESISKTGGHLASNLGVVEITTALHYVIDSPEDKIVFDVGHQAYVHKIITGRKDEFDKLRKYKGLSGFPKTEESEHDHFNTGHSSTSISSALGIAIANKLNGNNNRTYAIIGDGALTGGMAYEALNNAGRLKPNIVVILNDNDMSISKNVGAVSKTISSIRYKDDYIEAKQVAHTTLAKVPVVGKTTEKVLSSVKQTIRSMVTIDSIFETLGFRYYGIIDGHNINDLLEVFESTKKIEGPILIHIKTKKGKGYEPAENQPELFHGVPTFDKKTGEIYKVECKTPSYSNVAGKSIVDLAKKNENILAVTAAMGAGTGLDEFKKECSKRFFDVGIAEEHAITFAGGLAITGKLPIVTMYSTFLQRAYDQVIHDIALQNLHVIIAIDRAGLVGSDGETHQGVFDISFLGNIPNIVVLSPYTQQEVELMFDVAVNELRCPVAIRYPRGNTPNIQYDECANVLKPHKIVKGEKTCIVSVGNFTEIALNVTEKLNNKVGVVNARNLSDYDSMINIIKHYDNIIVLEDGQKLNGYGNRLLLKLVETDIKYKKFDIFAYDNFIEQGSVSELLDEVGITVDNIIRKIETYE